MNKGDESLSIRHYYEKLNLLNAQIEENDKAINHLRFHFGWFSKLSDPERVLRKRRDRLIKIKERLLNTVVRGGGNEGRPADQG